MPEYLAPGVFIEEVDSGSKPIEGVGVNTAAFLGFAKSGEFNTPTFITNWTQFCQLFGESEHQFLRALSDETGQPASDLLTGKRASRKSWNDYAQSVVRGAIASAGNSQNASPAVSVRSYPEFLGKYKIDGSSSPYLENAYLAHAVRGYYDNGGGRCYIVRIARPEDVEALQYTPGSTAASDTALPASSPLPLITAAAATASVGPFLISAKEPGVQGNDIRIEMEPVGDDSGEVRIRAVRGSDTEQFGFGKEKPLTVQTAMEAINGKSKLVQVAVAAPPAPDFKFQPLQTQLSGGIAEAPQASVPASASASVPVSYAPQAKVPVPLDFEGDEARRTGIGGLYAIDDINMIAAPDLMAGVWQRQSFPGMDPSAIAPEMLTMTAESRQQILDWQCGLVKYCERMGDRMAILDPIPGLSPQEMRDTTLNTPYNCSKGQAAIYYPWIRVPDPHHRGQQLFVPPSGHIAGVWARTGAERGVHKAPANEALMGALALEVEVTKGEQEILNPEGINCIRAFPGLGIRVWGARTLATVGNPSWKYVNVRRLFNYLEKSMERGLQWVVFEPNDQDLWGRVRRNISAFLFTEWKEGKFFGMTQDEAYYVKCNSETNPQEMIDLGRLYVEVGINPVKPAEFVIVRMGQWSGGSDTAEE